MEELLKKYPNDQELGQEIRKRFAGNTDQAIELLKEVIALHGFGGYGYANGLVERGKYYLETEDGKIRRWQNSCDGQMMDAVDDKIIEFLKRNT
jgi:hypothetical protein